MKIAIYGQFYNKNSLTYIDSLLDVLINKSISFYIESKFYQAILDDHPEIDPAKYKSFTTLDNTFDLLISIGGDGTILRAITFIKDKQSAFLQFIQGKLDFISGIDASYKDEILTNKGELQEKYKEKVILQSEPYLNTEYLGFLMETPLPLKIRQAINYGFDRVKMLKYLRNNIGTPANQGFIPMGLPPFSEKLNGYSYKPEKARQLVLAAEIENGFDANKEIILSTTSSYLDLCEYIQNQLQDIGLKVRVEVSPASTHRQMVATSKLNFFRGSWIADYPDAENYLSLFYSKNFCPNGPNYTHFKNEVFDALYEKALSETNIETRHAYYQQMDSLIIESAVIVPLYYDRVLRFTNKIISGFESNAMNLLDLKRVRK